jgi:hypothetical protein
VLPALLGPLMLATSLATPPGAAENVHWSAPAACPRRTRLIAAITADLGRPLAPADADALTAHAAASRRADGRWQLALTIEPRAAAAVERSMIADECALLVDAAALMIAAAIDPELGAGTPTASPTSREPSGIPLAIPAPEPTRTSALPPISAPSTKPAAKPPRPLRGTLAVAAALDTGALPRPAGGLLVRAGLLTRRLRVELGAVHWFTQRVEIAGTTASADLRLTAAQLQACPRLIYRRLEVPLCAGLELGAMHGAGHGLALTSTDRRTWLAALADARLLWAPLARLALGVELGLAVPLLITPVHVGGLDGDLHRAAPAAFRGAQTIEQRIP